MEVHCLFPGKRTNIAYIIAVRDGINKMKIDNSLKKHGLPFAIYSDFRD